MNADQAPTIDLDDLLRRIRSEVERRRDANASSADGVDFEVRIPHATAPRGSPQRAGDLSIGALLEGDDEDFLDAAYAAALGRSPDEAGKRHFLHMLRSGELSKVEVVGRLRYSPEGRTKGRRIRGLLLPFAWRVGYRVPVLGYLFALMNFLLRLPVVVRNVEAFENNARWRLRMVERQLNEQGHGIDATFGRVREALRNVARNSQTPALVARGDALEEQLALARTALSDLAEQQRRGAIEAKQVQALSEDLANRLGCQLESMQRLRAEHESLRQASERLAELPTLRMAISEASEQLAELPRMRIALSDASERIAELGVTLVEGERRVQELALTKVDATRVDEINARLVQSEHLQVSASALARLEERVGLIAGSQLDRGALDAHLRVIEERIATKAGHADVGALGERVVAVAETKADRVSVELLRAELDGKLTRVADAEQTRAELARLERFLDDLRLAVRTARPTHAAPLAAGKSRKHAGPTMAEPSVDTDAFYVDLETEFRGTREQVTQRAEPFLPVVAAAQAGTDAAPIIDLGCGRGEWLELLRDRGLRARGVELNPLFVELCKERALDVDQADALVVLREAPAQSLGAVTAFHLAEHLSLEYLISLIDEARRALKPGGVMILETPNPENLMVGACNFYLDPTHRNPIPPALLQFLASSRGFSRVEVRRLVEHRVEDPFGDLPDEISRVPQLQLAIALLRQAYYSAPDYAVIAYNG